MRVLESVVAPVTFNVEDSVVAPPSAMVNISVPLSWKTTMLSVPLWLTRRPTLSECVWSSKDTAVMLLRMYFI